jgi:uncharacterized membrane protein SpoIIM required for sporulation
MKDLRVHVLEMLGQFLTELFHNNPLVFFLVLLASFLFILLDITNIYRISANSFRP